MAAEAARVSAASHQCEPMPVPESRLKLASGADSSEPEPAFGARRDDADEPIGDRWLMFTQQNRIEIRLLGTFDVTVDGRPAGSSGSKRDALLALLALRRGRPVSVDALIDDLWGSDLPSSPRNAVQHHVARLRGTLGQDAIVGSPNGYALPAATTDALVFEALLAEARTALRNGDARAAADVATRALSLWRGTALEGLADTDSIRAEAARLEELRIDALEERFEAALELGEHREIVSELQLAVRERPFRERLWRQLMLALYRSGRAADALEAYQSARRVHVEQLGLEPGPELRRTQEAILDHDPELVAVSAMGPEAPTLPLDNSREEFVRVLDQLRANLRHAEELYEWACGAAEGIAPPAPSGPAVASLAA
jgi:DNA-binding SARP family transcriptional activator